MLHGTCLQCTEFFFIHQFEQPCLSKNPKYSFYTIKSSLTANARIIHQYVQPCLSKNSKYSFYTIKSSLTANARIIHQYVQPCLSKNSKYSFYTIKSSLTLAYKLNDFVEIRLPKTFSALLCISRFTFRSLMYHLLNYSG